MVGTAYLAPEPGKPSFVAVGDKVTVGQTLLIIEAMKTFNPIKAPKGGTVTQILVDNATDILSSTPSHVEAESAGLMRRDIRMMGGKCLCCAAHGFRHLAFGFILHNTEKSLNKPQHL
jgi:hypothetical protein